MIRYSGLKLDDVATSEIDLFYTAWQSSVDG